MSKRLLVATRKGLFSVERTGANGCPWTITGAAFVGDHLPMVLPDARDGSVLAVLHHGHFGSKMHRSRDGGATWQECAIPVYPEKPAGEVDLDPWRKTPREWRLEMIWCLEAGNADQPGLVWCGTLPGGLFRSDDGGDSWQLVRSLWDNPKRKEWSGGGADFPGIHSICVDPRDGQRVSVGVSCGGVWQTSDGGASWNCRADGMWASYTPPEHKYYPNIQDVHRLVQCPSEPECLWAQHHNAVFRSTDGAASWQDVTNIQPSVFGFAVAVHPNDHETAWFVPAIKDERRIPVNGQVVVARTRDGGKTCEVLRRGLPQEHAYDLTYRHGLDVDETGQSLAFGSTTGSLWVTDDGGDSWQQVAGHLPPIYCVRFVK
jgi:hypothetical protein